MFLHSCDLHVALSLSRGNEPDCPVAVNFNERKHEVSVFPRFYETSTPKGLNNEMLLTVML